ncbi:phosphatase PAP2 family protein [Facklamia miroungae]|uniref:Undecaprenyl-diphosphatase n=1 Tax=Facklamia miroungae TaxID=120956 RepID=A0A1G7QFD6_9LACT|nr:phosphatase PAP2 family protein [Facklamia miroungae]NKZ28902.1 phosphatase PAP2 family protein [Facklamia miroungae]SDF96310.1 undecaprenyl-diphosphatase [Facklamia miroungae]
MNKKIIRKVTSAYFLFAALSMLFVHLGLEIKENDLVTFDTTIQNWVRNHHSPVLDHIMLFITHSSSALPVLIIFAFIVYQLYRQKLFDKMRFILVTIPGTMIINTLLKLIFQRNRPDLINLLVEEKFYSFPSGHAMISSTAVFAIIVLFWQSKHFYKIMAVGILYTFFVGYSRIYLGVHYPSDIIGGWIISFAWVILAQKLLLTNNVIE